MYQVGVCLDSIHRENFYSAVWLTGAPLRWLFRPLKEITKKNAVTQRTFCSVIYVKVSSWQ